ncbi:MAG TPA: rhamnan synthesis F family protein [Bacteroidia bacterium]|jgi:lipopolysaccharide biosynthesis protein|nr:rhamnan synthesis F family protein [Bacteroidia bacterium]
MKSICLFCSYFDSDNIPNYVQYYLKELTKHFTKVIFITNEKELTHTSSFFLENNKIEPFFVSNEGHDFGMWYKAMLKYNIEEHDRVGLINDSCVLFKPLDDYFNWLNSQNLDYAGMTDSEEIVYHIQSYFLILNKKAIEPTLQFFKKHGLQNDREGVINTYELGLCKYLQGVGLKVGAWFPYQKYLLKFNPSVYAAYKMIEDKSPLIKKKIVFNSFSNQEYKAIFYFKEEGGKKYNYNPKYYISIIERVNKAVSLFDFNLLKADGYNPSFKRFFSLWLISFFYQSKRCVFYILGPIYRGLGIKLLRDYFRTRRLNNFSEK